MIAALVVSGFLLGEDRVRFLRLPSKIGHRQRIKEVWLLGLLRL